MASESASLARTFGDVIWRWAPARRWSTPGSASKTRRPQVQRPRVSLVSRSSKTISAGPIL